MDVLYAHAGVFGLVLGGLLSWIVAIKWWENRSERLSGTRRIRMLRDELKQLEMERDARFKAADDCENEVISTNLRRQAEQLTDRWNNACRDLLILENGGEPGYLDP